MTNKGVNFKAEILEWVSTWPASPLGEKENIAKVSRTLSAKVWWASHFNELDPNDVESVNPALNNMQRYPEGVYGQAALVKVVFLLLLTLREEDLELKHILHQQF